MSGSLVLRSGVGTQMLMVSRSRMASNDVVARSFPVGNKRGECCRRNVADVGVSRIQAGDFALMEIDAGDVITGFGILDGQRQTHIAEPDDTHAGCLRSYLFGQYLNRRSRGWFGKR